MLCFVRVSPHGVLQQGYCLPLGHESCCKWGAVGLYMWLLATQVSLELPEPTDCAAVHLGTISVCCCRESWCALFCRLWPLHGYCILLGLYLTTSYSLQRNRTAMAEHLLRICGSSPGGNNL